MNYQTHVLPPSVNFHLWQPCNMRCKYCFATFQDVKREIVPKGHLPREQGLAVTKTLSEFFQKITFVGGEPTLCPWLDELIDVAKEAGQTTMIVTNGSRLTKERLKRWMGRLDWITLSVDSPSSSTMEAIGRSTTQGAISAKQYIAIAQQAKAAGYRLKVNTVVTTLNQNEDLSQLILAMSPERWKIFQALPIQGQNHDSIEPLLISQSSFATFVDRHKHLEKSGIVVVPESNKAMTGSYAMVDPAGRFFDNVKGQHQYSQTILEVGLPTAWQQVHFDMEQFQQRGGNYSWD